MVANNARRHLNRIAKQPKPEGRKTKVIAHTTRLLTDERKVKQPDTPWIAFTRERWASGDYKDVRPADAARSLSKEWQAMNASDKKVR